LRVPFGHPANCSDGGLWGLLWGPWNIMLRPALLGVESFQLPHSLAHVFWSRVHISHCG